MALNKALVTPAEADIYLYDKSDWLALDDTAKENHIAKASVYIQTSWDCLEVDYDDETTITDTIAEACSYYAYADFVGNLYPSLDADGTAVGRLTQATENIGSLQTTYKYSDDTGSVAPDPLDYPDTLMATECSSTSSGIHYLLRV